MTRIVILGGGFGGLNVAKGLGSADAEVTVIDRSNHHLFQPLLYQVSTATLSPADISMPIRHVLRRQLNTRVILAEVADIDLEGQRVVLQDAASVPFDYLVVATGATHSYFGHSEWEKVARGLKTIEDATLIRSEVLAAFEFAERTDDIKEQTAWTTFLIVGAGPTGVEMAGAVMEIARMVLKDEFRTVATRTARVVLIEGTDRVLPVYDPSLSERARRDLERLGVEVQLETRVTSVDSEGVSTNKGRIEGRTVIWAAGVQASPVAKWLKAPGDRVGRVSVTPKLSVAEWPNIYVIGDCAAVPGPDGKLLPGLAAVAQQQGQYVGRQLSRVVAGELPGPDFEYKDKGVMATIGRSRAIAQFGGFKLSGVVAWTVWLFVHIMLLVGFRNKVSVLMQWAWAYFTWDRGARLITTSGLDKSRSSRPSPNLNGVAVPLATMAPAKAPKDQE
jgi:NADH dehydrogenase